ncbi:MAG: hypothetical protein EA412_11270 [Chitinophagaceae bacterium]|nr:MAG: hypothetical protein EA412_11270 [Chitinophagaceae bacterium]
MKKHIYLLGLLLIFPLVLLGNWNTYNASRGDFSFDLPGHPLEIDTLNLLFYSLETDSTVAFSAHFMDSMSFDNFDPYFEDILMANDYDTLLAIGSSMLTVANSIEDNVQLINMVIGNDTINGLEVKFKYEHPDYNYGHMYAWVFIYNNRFYVFSTGAADFEKTELDNHSSQFFKSIQIW